ncbi:hypothetical protein BDN70DRAFT_508499 [Pholiota conissans]|uniref:Uncharacterized protein n=1 Tax=Pholiota conissans TaxID=109636 RepID=A0A9P6CSG5_9AGAR|nr:hypothetical protein BDN70DRAFT_508499 [Pholiota conissans]
MMDRTSGSKKVHRADKTHRHINSAYSTGEVKSYAPLKGSAKSSSIRRQSPKSAR